MNTNTESEVILTFPSLNATSPAPPFLPHPSPLTPSPQYNQFTMAKILFYSLFSWTSATQILVVHK